MCCKTPLSVTAAAIHTLDDRADQTETERRGIQVHWRPFRMISTFTVKLPLTGNRTI